MSILKKKVLIFSMLRAFVIGFLKNDPPPPPPEIDFQGVNVKVSYLQLKKKTRDAYFWLFLDNIITDKEETKPNSCSDS